MNEIDLKKIKNDIEKTRNLRYKATAKLDHLEKERNDLIKQMKNYNLDPDNLEVEIKNLMEKINNSMVEIRKVI